MAYFLVLALDISPLDILPHSTSTSTIAGTFSPGSRSLLVLLATVSIKLLIAKVKNTEETSGFSMV
jgi:hypothetical protein